jgi:chromate reductase
MTHYDIVSISGSLRMGSLNTRLLEAAAALAPEGARIERFCLRDIPLYHADVEAQGIPDSVQALKDAIAGAHGVLIATPEYNYSVPGVLKNAIDWASRPGYKSVFVGKPVAIVSASGSAIGGARAQGHLKQILLAMLAEVYPAPELAVGGASKAFDEQSGKLTDDAVKARLERFVADYVAWMAKRSG